MGTQSPQLDEKDRNARKLIRNPSKMRHEGYISLHSESHPVEFRNIRILPLKK